MKALLLNLINSVKTPVTSAAKCKEADATASFATSLKENYPSDLNEDQSFSLLSSSVKALPVVEETQVGVDMDRPVVGTDTKVECGDRSASHDCEGEIASNGKEPGGEQVTAELAKPSIHRAGACETTKVSLDRRGGKVTNELKEILASSPKKSEKASKKDGSAGKILAAGNASAAPVCNGETLTGCCIQGNDLGNNIDRVARSDENCAKSATIAVGDIKSERADGTLKKVTSRETQGSMDEISRLSKDGNEAISTSTNLAGGHQPDKTLDVTNDVAAVPKADRGSEQFGSSTFLTQSNGNVHGTVVMHSVEGMTAMNNAQIVDHSNAAKGGKVDQSAGARGAMFVDVHESTHRSNPGGSGETGPMLLVATAKTIEVGVASGTHGWLKISAEMEHGVVSASIATKSTLAQEILHHELPLLNAFLQEEKVGGGVVAIRQIPSTSAEGMGHGSDTHGREQPMHPQSGKSNDAIATGDGEQEWGSGEHAEVFGASQVPLGYLSPLSATSASMGGWLNIRV